MLPTRNLLQGKRQAQTESEVMKNTVHANGNKIQGFYICSLLSSVTCFLVHIFQNIVWAGVGKI